MFHVSKEQSDNEAQQWCLSTHDLIDNALEARAFSNPVSASSQKFINASYGNSSGGLC